MLYHGDALDILKTLDDNSIDSVICDPPYGYSFMNKDWDKAVVSVDIWKECLRVLKHGAFAAIMSSPRQDVLSRMIVNLQDAGFRTDFTSIYWSYASGFPKAANVSKLVDKRLGVEPLEVKPASGVGFMRPDSTEWNVTKNQVIMPNPTTREAKALDGSYAGFQPKPAVEVILMVMKPLSEKTFVDQALSNSKGITWLDSCRIPFQNEDDKGNPDRFLGVEMLPPEKGWNQNKIVINSVVGDKGRFPANLLVENSILDIRSMDTHNDTFINQSSYTSIYCWLNVNFVIKNSNQNLMMSGEDLEGFVVEVADGNLIEKMESQKLGSIITNVLEGGIENGEKKEVGKFINNLIVDGFGRNYTEKYQRVTISIIKTETNLTIQLKTLNYYPILNIGISITANEKITKLLMESKIECVSVVNTTNLLLSFTNGQQVLIMDIVKYVVGNISKNGKSKLITNKKEENNYSRYFSLDKWFDTTFPFLAIPKASTSERNKGLDKWISKVNDGRQTPIDNPFQRGETVRKNIHPAVKPIKLMAWLVTLLSRPNDTILDPFMGSGTTCIAAKLLKRKYIGIEKELEYIEIARQRINAY